MKQQKLLVILGFILLSACAHSAIKQKQCYTNAKSLLASRDTTKSVWISKRRETLLQLLQTGTYSLGTLSTAGFDVPQQFNDGLNDVLAALNQLPVDNTSDLRTHLAWIQNIKRFAIEKLSNTDGTPLPNNKTAALSNLAAYKGFEQAEDSVRIAKEALKAYLTAEETLLQAACCK